MARTWELWGNIIIAALLALPLAAALAWLLARRRARAGHPAPVRTALADVGIPAGTLPWLWMILTPATGQEGVSLVPFTDLVTLADAPAGAVLTQVGGNLLVFAALGALLPVRGPRLASVPRVAAVAAAASVTVEVLQYVLRLGRYSSVDDVLVNTAGAVLAALVTRRWWAPRIRARPVPE
ncbi:VanZ family protein [Nonomuraea rhodomycinica]|uniref:VanZ family protein n=1 Tax=Nonomuraea rhodomycinica TaxID=1712872 RepID=UPI001C376249|nr:VanZ family protein [Nonomuraea rhodomycinica]